MTTSIAICCNNKTEKVTVHRMWHIVQFALCLKWLFGYVFITSQPSKETAFSELANCVKKFCESSFWMTPCL